MLRESQKIALKVLAKLNELGWKQADLAREMGVSPQQITKIVSGKENLSIETQIKLQTILDIPVLATYYEDRMKESRAIICVQAGQVITYEPVQEISAVNKAHGSVVGKGSLKVVYNSYTDNETA